jgi:hypothetical protein
MPGERDHARFLQPLETFIHAFVAHLELSSNKTGLYREHLPPVACHGEKLQQNFLVPRVDFVNHWTTFSNINVAYTVGAPLLWTDT